MLFIFPAEKPKTYPTVGSTKQITKFYWWPVRIREEDGVKLLWLEKATIEYTYKKLVLPDMTYCHMWKPTKLIERKL